MTQTTTAVAASDDDAKRNRLASLRTQHRSLPDMEARQAAIRSALAEISALDEPGDDDLMFQGTLIQEHDDLEEIAVPQRKRSQALDRIMRAAQDPAKTESGDGARTADLVTNNTIRMDPFRELDRVRNNLVDPVEVRGRALDAIEQASKRGHLVHDWAENASQKAQDQFMGQSKVAQHILQTGSPEYIEAFAKYLADPIAESNRTALSLTPSAQGGFMLPFILDPTIILTNASSANPWRRISNVKQTTSNTWNGVNSSGVQAGWLAEATIVPDATPTVGNIVVTPQKAAAWVFGSYEVLEDTDFGQQLPGLLADAKDRLEEQAFATGVTGSGQPQGVVNGATTVVTTATTLTIALGDVYAVQAALPARFRNSPNAAWVANVAIINAFRQLDTAGGASFWTNLGKGQPETLLGAPIYESTTMSATKAVNSLEAIFGDFGQYIIVDRVGVSMIYEPLVKGTGGILPAGQAGWFMFWRVGANLSTVNGFRVMKGL